MKHFLLFISLFALALAVAIAWITHARTPSWLRGEIISTLTKSCPLCKVELESVEVRWWPTEVVLHHFEYIDSPEHSSRVAVKVRFAEIEFDAKAYLNGLVVINRFRAEGIDFVLTESPSKNSTIDDTPPLSGLPALVIRETEVSDSSFSYVHKIFPHEATLHLSQIHGSLGSWVTRSALVKEYAPDRTSMLARGVLEHTGEFEVKAKIDPLSQKGTLRIEVDVKNQPLPDVSAFFLHESGMELDGQISDVSTHFDMADGEIDGSLKASYSGLKIKIENRKNSGVKNFLETVGAKIVINSEQGVKGKKPGETNFHDQRTVDQSLFKAMFHALGRAATNLVRQ